MLDHPAAANVAEEIRRIVEGLTPGPLHFAFELPGGPRWVEALPSPVHGPDGAVVAIRGVSRDITERVVDDAQLRESEAKFRMVAEAMAIPVFLVRGTELLYVNAASERVLGYGEGELLGMPFWQIMHPEDRPLVRLRAEARQRGETIPPMQEYRIVTKSGETRWVQFDAVLISVALTERQGSLRLEVLDDGCGFDPNTRSAPALGLVGMRERALALGGRFTIESAAGRGTAVAVEWPTAHVLPAV